MNLEINENALHEPDYIKMVDILEARLKIAVEALRVISTDTPYNYQQEARRALSKINDNKKE